MQPDSERRAAIISRLYDVRKTAPVVRAPGMWDEIQRLTECEHQPGQTVRYLIAGGAHQAKTQCAICGDVYGNAIRTAARLPNWDAGKLSIWVETKVTEVKAIFARYERREVQQLTEMRAEHSAYLQTPTWRQKRLRVLERAGGICEGCRERRATQVHHLTYKHWGRELLFELVALCDECHHICHEERVA